MSGGSRPATICAAVAAARRSAPYGEFLLPVDPGGADIATNEIDLLHRITWALNQVKGRVIVVGHTDDQPVRSLKFKDNFELSTARAQNTLQILAQGLDDPRRLEASGAGDHAFSIRSDNLVLSDPAVQNVHLRAGSKKEFVWRAHVVSPETPWVAVVVPDGEMNERVEVTGAKIPYK